MTNAVAKVRELHLRGKEREAKERRENSNLMIKVYSFRSTACYIPRRERKIERFDFRKVEEDREMEHLI